jgi:hypothetical protein
MIAIARRAIPVLERGCLARHYQADSACSVQLKLR